MSADDRKKSVKFNDRGGKKDFNRRGGPQVEELESKLIILRRVTKVTKGGKNMKFSALVVVGDRKGKVGFGLRKGLDFQDALAKATKKAHQSQY
jgi:small subunit ribosomal protein S5